MYFHRLLNRRLNFSVRIIIFFGGSTPVSMYNIFTIDLKHLNKKQFQEKWNS